VRAVYINWLLLLRGGTRPAAALKGTDCCVLLAKYSVQKKRLQKWRRGTAPKRHSKAGTLTGRRGKYPVEAPDQRFGLLRRLEIAARALGRGGFHNVSYRVHIRIVAFQNVRYGVHITGVNAKRSGEEHCCKYDFESFHKFLPSS
jgi:hypothetical protein